MISHKHKFIFIHIPKTGGNSTQNILKYYSEDIVNYLPSSRPFWRWLVKLCLVYPKNVVYKRFGVDNKELGTTKHSKIEEYYNKLGTKIQEYFKFACFRNPWDRTISHYFSPHSGVKKFNRNQFIRFIEKDVPAISYITINGKIAVDYVMKFENLQEDFNTVCDKIGIKKQELPHINKSNHKHYTEYYDDETRELVAKAYKKEIEYFGYKFGKK